MPYITPEKRAEFDEAGQSGHHPRAKSAGELNYELTMKCLKYLEHNGTSYQKFNDIIGALEGCKLEIYRRMVAPYEDVKRKENGDVY